jgi:hypothetical protein
VHIRFFRVIRAPFSNLSAKPHSYTDMRLHLPFHIKPVHTLLAAFALLAIASILFFYSKSVTVENTHSETSEGAGSFHSPLICI